MAKRMMAPVWQFQLHFMLVLGLASLIALGGVIVGVPDVAAQEMTDILTFRSPDGTDIPPDMREVVGSATLTRSESGILIEADTTQLDADATYSNWWVIFNNPEACDEDGCNASDLGNPAVEASVLFATGRVADAEGNATFRAFLPTGTILLNRTVEGRERHRLGPGVQNPTTAEVHYIIRNHGPAAGTPGEVIEQIGTFNGGCQSDDSPMGFACYDQQSATFKAP